MEARAFTHDFLWAKTEQGRMRHGGTHKKGALKSAFLKS